MLTKPLRKKNKEDVEQRAKEIEESVGKPSKPVFTPIDTNLVVSTGSTLLDLAICGGRIKGGGIPGGQVTEIYGPSGAGKTAILVEVAASVQNKGGDVVFCDPEARLDKQYARVYGMKIKDENYFRPDTVLDIKGNKGKIIQLGLEGYIREWEPENEDVINVFCADSIAALSTETELDTGDKRGQRKAKELSEAMRKSCRRIAQNHKLVMFSNQVRQGDYGYITPGGWAIGFHASLRLQITRKSRIVEKKKTSTGYEAEKVIGIESEVLVRKSSIDDEYRTAPIVIMFGVGIDDIRANLAYLKEHNKSREYLAIDKTFPANAGIKKVVSYIEENNLERKLREEVIDLWTETEKLFKINRKPKVRF